MAYRPLKEILCQIFFIHNKYMISIQILKITFLNKPELFFFFCTQLNVFTLFQMIQFSKNTVFCLHTVSQLFKYSFCFHTVKCKTVLFQTIHFSTSTKLNDFKYWFNSDNSIKHQLFFTLN